MPDFRDRMRTSAKAKGSRTVLALDLWDPYDQRAGKATKVLESTADEIAAVKLNHHLLLPLGLEGLRGLVKTCKGSGLPIIADLKLNDIEATNLNAVDTLLAYGIDAVIANPFVGKEEGLGGVVSKMHEMGGGAIMLVYMSHAGSEEGYGLALQGGKRLYAVFAERARAWGADGVVVSAKSAQKIQEVRGIVGTTCDIYSPGMGAQGGVLSEGAGRGADYLIVGRAIVESPDPKKAAIGFKGAP